MIAADSSIFFIASKIFWWILDEFMIEFVFFWADVKGTFCGEYIINDGGSGGVFNATVVDRVFVIAGGDV